MDSASRPGATSSSNGAPGSLNPGRSTAVGGSNNATATAATLTGGQKKKRKKPKKKNKPKTNTVQSFGQARVDSAAMEGMVAGQDAEQSPRDRPFYKLGHATGGNLSGTSLESEALLDHRDQLPMRARRDSRLGLPGMDLSASLRPSYSAGNAGASQHQRQRSRTIGRDIGSEDGPSDRTPLLGSKRQQASYSRDGTGFGGFFGLSSRDRARQRSNSPSDISPNRGDRPLLSREASTYDVNNPPSVPQSPVLGGDPGLDDVMVTDLYPTQSLNLSERRKSAPGHPEHLIDIDGDADSAVLRGSTPSTPKGDALLRRHTVVGGAEDDVCFPQEGLSEIGEEESFQPEHVGHHTSTRRRRLRRWPDLRILEEWSRGEKEERSEGIRAKKISEPVLVEGRLRPIKKSWRREEEDAPYRFTYFNEVFQSTIHSQTISELLQPGQSFKDLFIPDPPELSDSSSDEDNDEDENGNKLPEIKSTLSPMAGSTAGTRHSSVIGEPSGQTSDNSGKVTPSGPVPQAVEGGGTYKAKRFGNRPTFWLDVLSPTELEMRVLSKAFGIHPLTTEDILMQETREKVELFHNYYLVNYRTFEQDSSSENYLEPVNMYVVVFREGVLSFHFSLSPHPANVRRRIRQLKDYLELTADWISYAIIDDITDVFAPLIQSIEEKVDEIDDAILQLHTTAEDDEGAAWNSGGSLFDEKRSDGGVATAPDSGGNMLRRVGEARKKVMGIYRLLGNKADVIKGFAKRCNEQWDVAPRSDIGLYLGDIQDHVLTMTSNLSHCETLLSRAHNNYLAQINIRMNERQEKTADVLGKLTVLGTIVLPMNIITGMWGMNVLVPGQDVNNLYWFWSITAGLLVFGVSCFFIAKKVYGIV